MEKKKEVKVGKVIIEIGKREIALTIDEVRALKSALVELLGEKQVHHHYNYNDYWRPRYYGGAVLDSTTTATYALTEVDKNFIAKGNSLFQDLMNGQDISLCYEPPKTIGVINNE